MGVSFLFCVAGGAARRTGTQSLSIVFWCLCVARAPPTSPRRARDEPASTSPHRRARDEPATSPHLPVKTDVSAFGPSKTQYFSMIWHVYFDSAAEGLRCHAASIIFYNGLLHFWVLRFKSINIYGVCCMSKHSSFFRVFLTRGKHQFLQWFSHITSIFSFKIS